ncbi:MAG: hypothetical protein KatS3mg082_2486 [Nitrospiraceae bacterium]|nr:MAG: hypothetical protein KatS3mg082_2486 [Nitrospiraceae bacterium]
MGCSQRTAEDGFHSRHPSRRSPAFTQNRTVPGASPQEERSDGFSVMRAWNMNQSRAAFEKSHDLVSGRAQYRRLGQSGVNGWEKRQGR